MQNQQRILLYTSLGLFIFVLSLCSCQKMVPGHGTPLAEKGIIDLRQHDFSKKGSVNLDGSWSFYWKQWVIPEKTGIQKKKSLPVSYLSVPSTWNGHMVDGHALKGKGFATYALTVLLPEGVSSFAIHINGICSAYDFYINGEKKLVVGNPSSQEASAVPRITTQIVDVYPVAGSLFLLFHVSNYHYWKGGIWETVSIGPKETIHKNQINAIAVSFFLFGGIFLMGLYHLRLYFVMKTEPSYLYFAFFCLLVSLRIIVVEERLIMQYLPNLSMNMMFKLEYLSFYLGTGSILAYIYYLFPNEFNRVLHKVLQIVVLSFSSLVILLPSFYFSQTLKPFQMFAFICIWISTTVLILAYKRNRPGIKTFFIGLIFFAVTVINDLLYAMGVVETFYVFHLGSFVFIICQAMILVKKYAGAFETIKKQEGDLNKKNQDLLIGLQNREKIETDLKSSEEKYRELVENLYEIIYSISREGIILYVSPRIESVLGYTPRELMGRLYIDYIHPDDVSLVQKAFSDLKQNQSYPSEYRVRSKNKAYLWVRTFSRISGSEDNDSIQGVLTDISDSKQKEEALRQSERRFKRIFENANDGILIVDSTQKIVQSNRKMRALLGYSQKELETLHTSDIHLPEDLPNIVEQVNKMLKRELPLITNIRVRKKNRDIFFADVSSSLIELDGKRYVMGLFRDVTRLKEAQESRQQLESQLLQVQKMQAIGTLAAGVAHDFNNILSPIIGHSEMLLLDLEENSDAKKSVQEIYGSAMRAKDLVKQILTFSRQEKDEIKLIKIQPILKETIGMIRAALPPSIEIRTTIDQACGEVHANPTQMHQLIMNILTNAVHAIDNLTGNITVQLSRIHLAASDLPNPEMMPGTYNCLSISDTGMGMDEKLQQRIFEPFFTTKEKGKGTGMGLSVVHGVIENMKGGMKIKSEPGKGTEFIFYFPLAKRSFAHMETKTNDRIQTGSGHILFVDDEKEVVRINMKLLEKLGYTVDTCTDPLEALDIFRNNPEKFDLIITDLAMPKMTGDRLANECISCRPDIPVILITGFFDHISRTSLAESGIRQILQKPVSMKDLSRLIRQVMDGASV